jgi:hypothetical protein
MVTGGLRRGGGSRVASAGSLRSASGSSLAAGISLRFLRESG